ncbi:toll/interleukin-1 receptor domain-containing protein [Amnibacterium sp.]|uniref:toll/interleukin-1 receptor domain-containing protein n=1 Tax=Amnibacterium sp. TaxID=1872496 RepID=UPI0026019B3C|nr:toll/interleukin-1 receptor domain-containing protein [Amnibacterium sp.]
MLRAVTPELFAQDPEIAALAVTALGAGVPSQLAAGEWGEDREDRLSRIAHRLAGSAQIPVDQAVLAVRLWSVALGLIPAHVAVAVLGGRRTDTATVLLIDGATGRPVVGGESPTLPLLDDAGSTWTRAGLPARVQLAVDRWRSPLPVSRLGFVTDGSEPPVEDRTDGALTVEAIPVREAVAGMLRSLDGMPRNALVLAEIDGRLIAAGAEDGVVGDLGSPERPEAGLLGGLVQRYTDRTWAVPRSLVEVFRSANATVTLRYRVLEEGSLLLGAAAVLADRWRAAHGLPEGGDRRSADDRPEGARRVGPPLGDGTDRPAGAATPEPLPRVDLAFDFDFDEADVVHVDVDESADEFDGWDDGRVEVHPESAHGRFGTPTASIPAAAPAPTTDPSFVAEPVVSALAEDVQFTVYRPRRLRSARWERLLAFVHPTEPYVDLDGAPQDPVRVVEEEASAVLRGLRERYRPVTSDARMSVPLESELRFVPEVTGVDFDPPFRSFRWHGDVHREEFGMRADAPADGSVARGSMSVFAGPLLIADVPLTLAIGPDSPPAQPVRATGRPYRRVFASYSRGDEVLVRGIGAVIAAIGDEFERDVERLRSGEVWDERLQSLIREADVFQLFWSRRSMRSDFVRREWTYALQLGREGFVRPAYWERPRPEEPSLRLPPPELDRVHFSFLDLSLAGLPSGAPRLAPVPAPPPPPSSLQNEALAASRGTDVPPAPMPLPSARSTAPAPPSPAARPVPAGRRGRVVVVAVIIAVLLIAAALLVAALTAANPPASESPQPPIHAPWTTRADTRPS